MTRTALLCALLLMAPAAHAACYADYKAKKDSPLRLHYGVAEITQCDRRAAANELRPRLAAQGWTLLNVVSVFEEGGLQERADSAGPYYLRF